MARAATALLAGALLAGTPGCVAELARVSEMRVHEVAARPSPPHDAEARPRTEPPLREQSVALEVNGLGIFPPLFLDPFREAVAASIADSGLFGAQAEPAVADLRLDVILGDLLIPDISNGPTVELTILWSLSERETTRIRWQSLVWSTFSPEAPEGTLLASDAGRLAVEGAARENIRQALQLLAGEGL